MNFLATMCLIYHKLMYTPNFKLFSTGVCNTTFERNVLQFLVNIKYANSISLI